MNRLKAYHKFNIEVEFKTYADNGIILYNQQKNDGTGDFVSLAIVDGLVSFIVITPKTCFLKTTTYIKQTYTMIQFFLPPYFNFEMSTR